MALEDACTRYPEVAPAHPDEIAETLDAARRSVHAAFALPADPRDLLRGIQTLGALAEAIAAVHDLLGAARPEALPEAARAQAAVLTRIAASVADAWGRVARRRDATAEIATARALERDGDVMRRAAIAALHASGLDPLEILRLQVIHEALETAIDEARAAADAAGRLAFTLRR